MKFLNTTQVKLNRSLCSIALLFAGVSTITATPETDLLLGHFEIQIDYEESSSGDPDAGWNLSISYDESNDFNTADGIVRLDPASTTIVATPDTENVLPSAFHGLGEAGDTLWRLPQSNEPGQIFLGLRTVVEAGMFQQSSNGNYFPSNTGNIIVELVDVSGPAVDAGGKFAMWESKSAGGVEMHFNSADGLDGNDRLEPVPIGGHTHYNYGLTEPGNYEVSFRASGRINAWQTNGNSITSSSTTFHFAVPFSSVARGAAELRLALDEAPSPAAIHPTGETVEYAPGQVSLVTQAQEIGGIQYPYAFELQPDSTSSAPAPHRVGIAGLEPVAFPAGTTLAATPLEILAVSGPGSAQWLSEAGAHYLTFSESGIYRVQVRAVGQDGTSSVYGPEFELVFLAGLEADYDFAAYADSFERSHGLPSGSLLADGSDYDGDGVADLLEYQLFWEGLDPAIADADKLPQPDPSDPEGLLVFHRDTYKDRINRYESNIVLEYSTDLNDWRGWSDRDHSYPLDQYETGAERGNAYARIQRRVFRLPDGDATPDKAFFRWYISED